VETANTPESRAERVKAHARAVGFDLVGITGTSVDEAFARYLDAMAKGYGADMEYLHNHLGLRRDVRKVWPDTRSVVVLAVSYADPAPSILEAPPDADTGYIARYARGRDYHLVVRQMLVWLARKMEHDPMLAPYTSNDHRIFVDTGPVLEKAFAQAAGLGWIGKNTLLIHPGHRLEGPIHDKAGGRASGHGGSHPKGHNDTGRTVGRGSWYHLAVMLTPLELAFDAAETDHCGSCRRCLDVCPTDAFPAPYVLDGRRCIATWTIESEHPARDIDPETIGPHVFGCDLCQEVCPWNRGPLVPGHRKLRARPENVAPKLAELGNLDTESFKLRFPKSAVRRVSPEHMKVVVGLVKAGMEQKAQAKTGDDDETAGD